MMERKIDDDGDVGWGCWMRWQVTELMVVMAKEVGREGKRRKQTNSA